MKKITLAVFLLFAVGATAQIPNNDFEIWVQPSGTYEEPVQWATSNPSLEIVAGPANVTRDDVNFHGGSAAAKLTTVSFSLTPITAYASGALSSGTITYISSPPSFQFAGGFDYTQRPGSLTGWYMYEPQGVDSSHVWVKLTRWNGTATEVVADGEWWSNTSTNTYTQFGIPLTYYSTNFPDTALIVALSSKRVLGLSGPDSSTLWLDDLDFQYSAGIDDIKAEQVNVYPNPATDRLIMDVIPGEYSAAYIYDMTGRLVNTLNVVGNSVGVSVLNNGQYILELRNSNGMARSTFAKQ